MKKGVFLILLILLVANSCKTPDQQAGGNANERIIQNFEDCAAAGNPVLESYPKQCIADSGELFIEENTDKKTVCLSFGGIWIATAEECEKITKQNCDKMNGNYNSCASACRNDPDTQICTKQCIQVCSFSGQEKHFCSPSQKQASVCTMEYLPVCGDNKKTYPNGCSACASNEIDYFIPGNCFEGSIGGQTDEKGCLSAAGYSWDKKIGACTREWELDETQKRAAEIAVEPLSYKTTVTKVQTLRCPGCFIVELQRNDNRMSSRIDIIGWKIKKKEMSAEECISLGGRTVNIVKDRSCEHGEESVGEVIGFISPTVCCVPCFGLNGNCKS
ncbi:hypothetical protein GF327_02465 [Candidatus Woesearchaeota archaeon]|nr:hypothetical protein [Candidatus Woesearchaeota archaeon]